MAFNPAGSLRRNRGLFIVVFLACAAVFVGTLLMQRKALAKETAQAAAHARAVANEVDGLLGVSPQTLTIPIGGYAILSMILSSAAPSGVPITPDRGAGGFVEALTVKLSSSAPHIAAVQPTVQFYPDGSSITTVVVVVNGLAPGTAVIHANALPAIPDVTATVIVQ